MRLLLTSGGVTTPQLATELERLVGQPLEQTSVAVINEAYAVEPGDHSWVIEELSQIRARFGGALRFVNLLALDREAQLEQLAEAQVIYCVGGHTDYLMSVFNRSGFSELLPELLTTKVYVGSSAGSMVMAQRVSTDAYREVYGEEGDFGVSEYGGFVDLAIKPHLDSEFFPNNRREILARISESYPGRLVGLSDTAALVVDQSEVRVVGENHVQLLEGQTA